MPPPPSLTPAQLALQAERRAAKLAKKAAAQAANGVGPVTPQQVLEAERRKFLKREWLAVGGQNGASDSGRRVKIITWNLLAQTLIRRELFPGSDCLKWTDRKPMLQAEMGHYAAADVICLQECDRLDDLLSATPSHSHVKVSGPGKLHGIVILYRTPRFTVRSFRTIFLDDEELSPSLEGDGRRRRGGTRQTRNVGLVVALDDHESGGGIVVATTHLFWHPKFVYERVRQLIILTRAIKEFQKDNDCESWPAVLSGDLNTSPSEAPYQLLVSPQTPLAPSVLEHLEVSRIVHNTVDKIGVVPPTPLPAHTPMNGGPNSTLDSGSGASALAAEIDGGEKDDKDDEDELPDSNEKSTANTRPPEEADGILPITELTKMLSETVPGGAKSAYGLSPWVTNGSETFGSRGGFGHLKPRDGKDEPAYTCFTPLFNLTLDYLFELPSRKDVRVAVVGLLRPPRKDELGQGLPRKGISASDHLAVGCELAW
ncbi:hypothetical protein JCM24511_04333 [Saitozyma sp. JCM 24511]|nr:hypothetical protein JCM24511_04333 [Saitozyma sp. JCM 24511]